MGNGVDLLKYGAAYHPFLKTVYGYAYDDTAVTLAHNVTDETNTTSAGAYDTKTLSELADSGDSDFNLILYNKIKTELEKQYVTLPPSSAMAGIYARVPQIRVPASRTVCSENTSTSVSKCEEIFWKQSIRKVAT